MPHHRRCERGVDHSKWGILPTWLIEIGSPTRCEASTCLQSLGESSADGFTRNLVEREVEASSRPPYTNQWSAPCLMAAKNQGGFFPSHRRNHKTLRILIRGIADQFPPNGARAAAFWFRAAECAKLQSGTLRYCMRDGYPLKSALGKNLSTLRVKVAIELLAVGCKYIDEPLLGFQPAECSCGREPAYPIGLAEGIAVRQRLPNLLMPAVARMGVVAAVAAEKKNWLLMEFGGNSCGKCPGSARLSW